MWGPWSRDFWDINSFRNGLLEPGGELGAGTWEGSFCLLPLLSFSAYSDSPPLSPLSPAFFLAYPPSLFSPPLPPSKTSLLCDRLPQQGEEGWECAGAWSRDKGQGGPLRGAKSWAVT